MKEITIEQGKINKINDCLDAVETAIDKEAYTEAGVKLRETCEHFASAVLDAFIGEGTSDNYRTLDDKIKAVKEYKCMAKDDINLLYAVKSYGNNSAHSEKSRNFDLKEAERLYPKLEALINSYISGIESKYEQYLTRKVSGEIELFKRIDGYITEAMSEFVRIWLEQMKKADDEIVNELYYQTPLLPERFICLEDRNKIKKALYSAVKNFMAIVCEFHRIDSDNLDYFELLKKLKVIEYTYFKDSDPRKPKSFVNFKEPERMRNVEINTCSSGYKPMISYSKNASGIEKDNFFSNRIVRLYDVTSYKFPYGIRDEDRMEAEEDLPKSWDGKTTFLDGSTREIAYFAAVRKICEDAWVDGNAWHSEIYGYICMLYNSAETIKEKYNGRYQVNSKTKQLISEVNAKIIEIENNSFSIVTAERNKTLAQEAEKAEIKNKKELEEIKIKNKELEIRKKELEIQKEEQKKEEIAQKLETQKLKRDEVKLKAITLAILVFGLCTLLYYLTLSRTYVEEFTYGFLVGLLFAVIFAGVKASWSK